MTTGSPTHGYKIPTQNYVLKDYELRITAQEVAMQTAQLVKDKNIDPNNLVIAMGEWHRIVQINLFGYYLIEALKTTFDNLAVCDEKEPKDAIHFIPTEKLTPKNLPQQIELSTYKNKSLAFYSYATACHTQHHTADYQAVPPYLAIDLNALYNKEKRNLT